MPSFPLSASQCLLITLTVLGWWLDVVPALMKSEIAKSENTLTRDLSHRTGERDEKGDTLAPALSCSMGEGVGAQGIQIVGGGLAGLTLGIALRRLGVRATIWEAGKYPRHRVCGEVFSGRGFRSLERLGLVETLTGGGGRLAQTTAFFSADGRSTPVLRLSAPAICVSRYHFDHYLASRFRELGGDLRETQRWETPGFGEGLVRATGRTAQTAKAGWRWFGIKAHCRNVELAADVEMHLLPWGYIGLCRLPGGAVNVCGLFRRSRRSGQPVESPQNWLCGPTGSLLRERLASAEWDPHSQCAVAGLPLDCKQAARTSECRIGDALTMIPPVTGNGMSMALEAAELASGPLAAYSRGGLNWTAACEQIVTACHKRFSKRLRWSRWLHGLMFCPGGRRTLLMAGSQLWAWRTMFNFTR